MKRALIGCAGVAAAFTSASAQISSQLVVGGLGRPLEVMQAPGDTSDRLFIMEQRVGGLAYGRISIFKNGALNATPFLQVSPVATNDEQGLLGLAFHPDYATNRKFYINYTAADGSTVIEEYQTSASNPDVADTTTRRAILSFAQPYNNHNGGWLGFGPDGYLYDAQGDGGSGNDPGNRAQMINNGGVTQYLGKLLRLDINRDDFPTDATRNYGIPSSNPFGPASNPGAEIWAYGLRNPWRPSFDRLTGDLWIADVGQDAWEEVNFQPANAPGGRNYGWRCMEGLNCTTLTGCTCNDTALTLPLFNYGHAQIVAPVNATGCSITGGFVYRGCAIPSLYGEYLFGDYCTGRIYSYDRASGVVAQILNPGGGLTSFGQDADGELYFCLRGSGTNGSIRKIVPTAGITDCNANGHPDCADIALGRSLDRNHDGIPDECQCIADFNGDHAVDFFDYLDFVNAFAQNAAASDFNHDGVTDFFDYLDFVDAFTAGCH